MNVFQERMKPAICSTSTCDSPASGLNENCFCTTLDRNALHHILNADDINRDVVATHPQLFSNTSVFISLSHLQHMQDAISAISRVIKLPGYSALALEQSPLIAAHNMGTDGVFMGYDFHLSEQGPQLIEINTNAGGAFLNAALVSAQSECCPASGFRQPILKPHYENQFMDMFLHEWFLQRGKQPLLTIAVVDENPREQFLYPEFRIAQRLFQQRGFNAIIVDPGELKLIDGKLHYQHQMIDLVYNRLTDFSFTSPTLDALRIAYEMDAVVVTPNPHHHALYADKRNLVTLSDIHILETLQATPSDIETLQKSIPVTRLVSEDNAEYLWQTRRQYFFKPATGFGSRAAYRGDKLTTRVWDEILNGDYVAQEIVPPSKRGVLVDGKETELKIDIRAYVYAGEIQLLAARLYQGQTTNFRTQGGGFAPVFLAP